MPSMPSVAVDVKRALQATVIAAQKAGDWAAVVGTMREAVDQLARAGADFAGSCLHNSGRVHRDELKQLGITTDAPSDVAIDKLDELIYAKLVPGNYAQQDLEAVQSTVKDAMSVSNADGLLLACSELALAINANSTSLPFVDANLTLAEAARAAGLNLDSVSHLTQPARAPRIEPELSV